MEENNRNNMHKDKISMLEPLKSVNIVEHYHQRILYNQKILNEIFFV